MFTAFFSFLYVLFVQYLIPIVLALGVIMFLYGSINYFVIGPGEEPKREEGRHQLLWALIAFLIGLAVYGLVVLLIGLASWSSAALGGASVEEDAGLQRVPDVPLQND